MLSFEQLRRIAELIHSGKHRTFTRVTDVALKSEAELAALRERGLRRF